jgi:hypothetical protein
MIRLCAENGGDPEHVATAHAAFRHCPVSIGDLVQRYNSADSGWHADVLVLADRVRAAGSVLRPLG